MWRTIYEKLSSIKHELSVKCSEIEHQLSEHSYYSFKYHEPELYIVYLHDKDPGPYPIKNPCSWIKKDKDTLISVIQTATNQSHAMSIWSRVLISGKDSKGNAISIIGRADLKIAQRIATPIPDNHPARKIKPKEKVTVFYEDRDE
jgi:hypothetical protein